MNKKLYNQIPTDHRYVVSLDAHKRTYYIRMVDVSTNKILYNNAIVGTIVEVLVIINSFNLSKKEVLFLYEAGCLGFNPYRQIEKNGYECRIIVPSSIPQNDRLNKTDRGDCKKNLHYHLSGLLKYVTVPTEEVLHTREISRSRDGLVSRIRKLQQQISALTLRYGYFFDGTKSQWTKKHRQWLKALKVPSTLEPVLTLTLKELDNQEALLAETEKVIEQQIKKNQKTEVTVKALELLPGFGQITSQAVALEIGDFNRFKQPNQIPRFVGLIPGKQQSGNKDPALSITKQGSELGRRMLVGASRYYCDHRNLYSQKDLDQLPEAFSIFMKKMQDRLHSRYKYLKNKGKHTNKVRCAIARELAIFIWEYIVHVVPKIENTPIMKIA